MDYRSKYFKYKNKYLELKELLGGTFATLPRNRFSINAVVQLILIGMLYCIKTNSFNILKFDEEQIDDRFISIATDIIDKVKVHECIKKSGLSENVTIIGLHKIGGPQMYPHFSNKGKILNKVVHGTYHYTIEKGSHIDHTNITGMINEIKTNTDSNERLILYLIGIFMIPLSGKQEKNWDNIKSVAIKWLYFSYYRSTRLQELFNIKYFPEEEPLIKTHATAEEPLIKTHATAEEPLIKTHATAEEPLIKTHATAEEPLINAKRPLINAKRPLDVMKTNKQLPKPKDRSISIKDQWKKYKYQSIYNVFLPEIVKVYDHNTDMYFENVDKILKKFALTNVTTDDSISFISIYILERNYRPLILEELALAPAPAPAKKAAGYAGEAGEVGETGKAGEAGETGKAAQAPPKKAAGEAGEAGETGETGKAAQAPPKKAAGEAGEVVDDWEQLAD